MWTGRAGRDDKARHGRCRLGTLILAVVRVLLGSCVANMTPATVKKMMKQLDQGKVPREIAHARKPERRLRLRRRCGL
jgi:hypothetical protein